jgi:hypothetical protein
MPTHAGGRGTRRAPSRDRWGKLLIAPPRTEVTVDLRRRARNLLINDAVPDNPSRGLNHSRYGATGGVVDALSRRSGRIPPLWVLSSHRREVGQTGTVGGGRRFCQEAVEVRAHDVVEHRLRRRARFVDLREHDGARQCRAAAPRYDGGTLSTGARDRASGLRLGACNPTGNVVFRGAGRGLAVVALVRVAAARPVPCRRRLHQSRPCGISRRVDGSTVLRRSASARAQPRTPAGHRDAAACRGRARSSRQHTRAPGRCESRRS